VKNVAILGYGTIGSGVYQVIRQNNSHVSRRAGDEVRVKYVLDIREFPGDPVESVLVHDVEIILQDPEVDVVVEVMGGTKPAYDFVKRAILAGKSVCTSNKELVAKHGAELLRLAKERNINFFFEASVGGGIPVIRPMSSSLTPDHIEEISGILNGTTNYILTKMTEEGLPFDTVLKEAQEKGYAERNPEADIEGYDACRKIAILASLAYEKQVDFEDIYTEGISAITKEDLEYAGSLGGAVKLLGMARKDNGKVVAMVAPFLVSGDSPLASVRGVFNAILVRGDMLGDVMFYGKGAGKLATASAVVADVIEAIRKNGRTDEVFWSEEKRELGSVDAFSTRYLVRIKGTGRMEEIEKAFGAVEYLKPVAGGETAFLTESMTGKAFREAAGDMELISRIRVL